MTEHLNGFTARERLLRSEYPRDKSAAPAFKELFTAAVEEHKAADAKEIEARKLKVIRELATELRYLTTPVEVPNRLPRITATVAKINELLKPNG